MENKKLKINVDFKTGRYIFDNGEDIISMEIKSEGESLVKTMKDIKERVIGEYGLSSEMISRVDPILYKKLKEYDGKNGTIYATRYLNLAAKEIERKENEPMGVYLDRCADIRKKALEETGMEIMYSLPKISEMKSPAFMSLIDKLEVARMAKRQAAIGASLTNKPIYDENMVSVDDDRVVESEVKVETTRNAEEKTTTSAAIKDERKEKLEDMDNPKMAMPSFLQEVLDKKMAEDKKAKAIIEPKPVVNTAKTIEPKAKKNVSRRKSIQASKKAMRESRKMKNVYKQKQNQSTNKSKTTTTQTQKTKTQKTVEYKAKHQAATKTVVTPQVDERKKKELQYVPIMNGEMVGVDSNRPSAIVKTFVINTPKKEDKVVTMKQNDVKPEKVTEEIPKKEKKLNRYTRKIKDKSDAIKSRIAMSKDRFKRIAAVAAVAAVVIVAGVITIPKAVASIPLGTERNSDVVIQAYDGVEQVAVKEVEVDASAPNIEMVETSNDMDTKVASYIRDVGMKTTGKVSDEETLSGTAVQTVDDATRDEVATTKEEPEVKSETEEKTAILSEDSVAYMNSVRVGTRMTIDSGKYYEAPDGTGKYGYFENHAGESKIINKIGIATNEGYISISTDDLSLLDLKQMYPDAKFSYHIVDEEGHVLGWLTSESFENAVEKQADDGMDR